MSWLVAISALILIALLGYLVGYRRGLVVGAERQRAADIANVYEKVGEVYEIVDGNLNAGLNIRGMYDKHGNKGMSTEARTQ